MQYKYRGFCGKFGQENMTLVSAFTPVALNSAMHALLGSAPITHVKTGIPMLILGELAFVCAAEMHDIIEKRLADRKTPSKRGTRFVQQWQAAVYALPVALGLGVSAGFSQSYDLTDRLDRLVMQNTTKESNTDTPEKSRQPHTGLEYHTPSKKLVIEYSMLSSTAMPDSARRIMKPARPSRFPGICD